jgi:hypothetical protein
VSFGNYQSQAPKPGKLVAYTLYGLRNPDGSSPVLDLEHLGRENRGWWAETLGESGTSEPSYGNTPSELNRAHHDRVAKYRQKIASHSARHLRNAFHGDGAPATDEDIQDFIATIPEVDIIQLWAFVNNPQPWREYPLPTAKPETVAEK